jgi:ABC-type Zn uptake system ZnuABC Zn-binding protein ZnuA
MQDTWLRYLVSAVALAAVAVLVAGCGGGNGGSGSAATDGGRLEVATTVAPITSIVAHIGGDRVSVTGIVPEGTNSHTFEPKPSAAAVLSRADLVFVNGLKLEDPTAELAFANLKDGAAIVQLGNRCIAQADWIHDFSFPRSDGKPNPHLWTDPTYARCYARVTRDVLSATDPANSAYYARNFRAFSRLVGELDRAMRTSFATIPRRVLLTYHDAYAYFARTYGWKVIGAIQVSDFEDPTAREVGELIRQVREERVPAIFGSEVFPSPVLEQIGREAGVRYIDVLRDDDLPGKPGEVQHSWAGLMRFDYVTMTEALGGDASTLKALRIRNVAPDAADYPQ